uniref:Cryptochrome DASH n=1 Tax=Alexandrium catenella TaxID=2925 RepID=A0A7S1RNF6_ALECA
MAAAAARSGGAGRGARALWFRWDLRLDDHPALHAACDGAESLLPVYVFDPSKHNVPTLAGARKSSARRARFLLESVACLRRQLESKGSGLVVGLGQPRDVLARLCGGCQAMYVTQGVCSEETSDEAKVAKSLKSSSLQKVWGGTLYMPQDCGCAPNNVPLLFTSFKNRAEGRGSIREPLNAPQRLPPLPELSQAEASGDLQESLRFMPTLEQLGYTAEEASAALEDDPRGVMRFEGGEVAAMQRMRKWMFEDDKLKEYFEIRNGMLGEGYSSKFSPWLAHGCLSPRRVWREAQRYERERVKNKSTYWLIFELTWRDFFVYMGNSYGDKIFVRGGITGDKTPWTGSRDALERWKDGRTGDPLVDANMRELKETGWMSNRGRQNVASYLIFDLGVDWRHGAAHFEELLLDYDPCSNWGNWVAAAGLTGQRVNRFNTKKQLKDYDPNHEYVNHWLKRGNSAPARRVFMTDSTATEDDPQAAEKGAGKGWGRAGGQIGGKRGGKAAGKGYSENGGGASGDREKRRRWQSKSHYEEHEAWHGA